MFHIWKRLKVNEATKKKARRATCPDLSEEEIAAYDSEDKSFLDADIEGIIKDVLKDMGEEGGSGSRADAQITSGPRRPANRINRSLAEIVPGDIVETTRMLATGERELYRYPPIKSPSCSLEFRGLGKSAESTESTGSMA